MMVIPTISHHNASMTRNLDIGLLRAFAVVADRRSMTAASQVLHLTQGAVSQQIARLETLAGGPLLARERRGLRLTPSGERLLGKARRLLALNDEIWTDINGGTIDGPVRLGVPYHLVGACLAPVLKSYAGACDPRDGADGSRGLGLARVDGSSRPRRPAARNRPAGSAVLRHHASPARPALDAGRERTGPPHPHRLDAAPAIA